MSKSAQVTISSQGQFDEILKASSIVIAEFYSNESMPLYQLLAESFAGPNVACVKIKSDTNEDLTKKYNVSTLPAFLLFRNGQVIEEVQGANPSQIKSIIERLAQEVSSLAITGTSGSGDAWQGAEAPRGYSDITDQVESKGCELLNADEDAGSVKVLFEASKPSALDKGKESSSKDWVQSGSDDQLLLFIPFQSAIKLHTLQITSIPPEGQDDVSRPGVIHLFINRTSNMDFGEAEDSEPTQAITLEPKDWNARGTANIGLRFVKFQKTTTLTIFVQRGDGEADSVRIDRVRLIGEAGAKREMGKLQKMGDDEE